MNQATNYFRDEEFNPHGYSANEQVAHNLSELHEKMNKLRSEYGKPMAITSGLRSVEDQMKINPKAPKSHHVMGEAADVLDRDASLYKWCKANESVLVDIGLWMEERQGPWQHFQIVPPKSGKRWFNP